MSRLTNLALAASMGSIGLIALQAAPAHAIGPKGQGELVGKLGYEGGAAPGGFHPTSGSVILNYDGKTPNYAEEARRSLRPLPHSAPGRALHGHRVRTCDERIRKSVL